VLGVLQREGPDAARAALEALDLPAGLTAWVVARIGAEEARIIGVPPDGWSEDGWDEEEQSPWWDPW
jgi:hypothetical protein